MAPCFDSFSLPGRVKEVGLRPLANSGENKPPLVVTGPEREREREREDDNIIVRKITLANSRNFRWTSLCTRINNEGHVQNNIMSWYIHTLGPTFFIEC